MAVVDIQDILRVSVEHRNCYYYQGDHKFFVQHIDSLLVVLLLIYWFKTSSTTRFSNNVLIQKLDIEVSVSFTNFYRG